MIGQQPISIGTRQKINAPENENAIEMQILNQKTSDCICNIDESKVVEQSQTNGNFCIIKEDDSYMMVDNNSHRVKLELTNLSDELIISFNNDTLNIIIIQALKDCNDPKAIVTFFTNNYFTEYLLKNPNTLKKLIHILEEKIDNDPELKDKLIDLIKENITEYTTAKEKLSLKKSTIKLESIYWFKNSTLYAPFLLVAADMGVNVVPCLRELTTKQLKKADDKHIFGKIFKKLEENGISCEEKKYKSSITKHMPFDALFKNVIDDDNIDVESLEKLAYSNLLKPNLLITHTNKNSANLLMLLLEKNSLEGVKFLVEKSKELKINFDLNLQNKYGSTIMMYAIKKSEEATKEYHRMISSLPYIGDINIALENKRGITAAHYAILIKSTSTLESLLKLNNSDTEVSNLVNVAAITNSLESIKIIFRYMETKKFNRLIYPEALKNMLFNAIAGDNLEIMEFIKNELIQKQEKDIMANIFSDATLVKNHWLNSAATNGSRKCLSALLSKPNSMISTHKEQHQYHLHEAFSKAKVANNPQEMKLLLTEFLKADILTENAKIFCKTKNIPYYEGLFDQINIDFIELHKACNFVPSRIAAYALEIYLLIHICVKCDGNTDKVIDILLKQYITKSHEELVFNSLKKKEDKVEIDNNNKQLFMIKKAREAFFVYLKDKV